VRWREGEPLLLHRLQILQETGCDLQPSLHTRKRNKELLNLAKITLKVPYRRPDYIGQKWYLWLDKLSWVQNFKIRLHIFKELKFKLKTGGDT
jgi:hypothetical protein